MEIKRKLTISILIKIYLVYFCCPTSCKPTENSIQDVEGNELQTHIKYHVFTASGGGLSLSARDRRYPCPHNVMQETKNNTVGLSIEIFPADHQQAIIKPSTDVNIAFLAATVCVQPTVWRLGGVDPFTGRRYVRINGKLGGPRGAETGSSWFKIERDGGGDEGYYKMVWCPSGVDVCEDVGVFVENGRRWLGLGGDTLLLIAFKKVDPPVIVHNMYH
ncbi:alpha-amylase/subtilisin inhibitor-like [Henckelia pumila]|uniref:alpha-amylase/subtilisin inhibitor-like n=1 Tax=Henckelia pumila TaxID=405737 RepID=UPI003C6E3C06